MLTKQIEYIISKKYLLFVSTIEARKNHELIYDMYIDLIESGVENLPTIYFVGRRGWKIDKLLNKLDNDKRIKNKLVILDNMSDNDLIALYQHCWFTIYPSFIEGYGLPVAESLSFGKYCLSSNAGSLPEAGGDFIDYINPYDIDKWKEKFLFLINNPDYIAQKEQIIQQNYHAVSWRECAKEILEMQTADSRQQTADSRQQTADSRQQTADSRQQTADSRQQTADRLIKSDLKSNTYLQKINKKIRVAFIHEFFPAGGAEVVTSMLAVELSKKDYEIFVFVYKVDSELLTDNDKKYINIIQITKEDLFEPATYRNTIVKKTKELNIDILVFVGGAMYVNIQGISQAVGNKSTFAFHGTPFWEVEDTKQNLLRKRNKNFFKKFKYTNKKIDLAVQHRHQEICGKYLTIYRSCQAFTVLCEQYKTDMQKLIPHHQSDKFFAIPNAILPAKITYNLNKKKQLLYLGRMSYADKRVDRLIEVWRHIYQQFPDWEFLLVGDGAERHNLEQKAKEYGLERIQFCGKTNKPYEYYNNAKILCMSSQFESFGLVLAEAQQAGVIPIAFNCSAGVESILAPNWKNGVLIEDFSLEDYTVALCKLMQDEDLQYKIQQNIIKKSQEYNIQKIGELWHQLFLRVLSE